MATQYIALLVPDAGTLDLHSCEGDQSRYILISGLCGALRITSVDKTTVIKLPQADVIRPPPVH